MKTHSMKQALEASEHEDLQYASETSSFSDDEVDLTLEIFPKTTLEELDMGKKNFFKSGPSDENFTEAVSLSNYLFHKYSTWMKLIKSRFRLSVKLF